ncbi:MAG: acyloxyacyl hydrolase [Candidatus Omnitrophica bacterium]|nr:acyloxyacyl hydrolase [Candidatus Omnitrophota bacterium]
MKKDFFAGYGFAKTESYKSYRFQTILIDFTRPVEGIKNLFFQIEPGISYVSSPSDNFEINLSFFAFYRFFQGNFHPYIKIGTGIIYLSTDFIEQSTHFNFATSLGLGFKFNFEKFSIYTEGRFRHISNAGMKLPNQGINSRILLIGLGYNF